jgi:formylglycine-generating enzyme required for sulfatase activity
MNANTALFSFFYFLIGSAQAFSTDTISPKKLISKSDTKQSTESVSLNTGKEKIRLFDNSELRGNLLGLDENKNLFWQNKSVKGEISFNYKSVSRILFNRLNRSSEKVNDQLKRLRLYFKNGDKLRCDFVKLSEDSLWVETGFTNQIKAPVNTIKKLEFLPSTHETLYDPSMGLENWKNSNSKSWANEDGDFVSVFSGSTGTTLPKKDVIEIEFEAEWERSFYLAIRIFSDSDGSSYGNVGYHLSFSNNRINLQVNKRKKGRIIRETLGSLMVKEIIENKKARISIMAHRDKKEFIIFINDQEVAHWKDSSEDFYPDGNGILFINQGGNSFIRLKELNISGWNSSFFPSEEMQNIPPQGTEYIVLSNGDSTILNSISGKNNSFSIKTKRGEFTIPKDRIKSIHFDQNKNSPLPFKPTEQILLTQSLGQLSCKLQSITDEKLIAIHPNFGKFSLSLNIIKKMKCNQHLLRLRNYFKNLRDAKKALDNQKPELALSILENEEPALRSWYWSRLSFLAQSMQSDEVLSFTPHPEKKLFSSSFAGNEDTVLSTCKEGEYALWSGHAKLASGSFTDSLKFPSELGRLLNEEQFAVTLTHPYWLGETEITQEQYEAVTSQNHSPEKNGTLPIVCSWVEAQSFCEILNKKEKPPPGYTWRLPTEAEWERACRADSTGPFSNSEIGVINQNENLCISHLSKYGWFEANSNNKLHPVKQKLPNALGLYDMHGNVWEWCMDSAPSDKSRILEQRICGVINPYSKTGEWKVLKGGCYDVKFDRCRSAYRGANSPLTVEGDRGFRVALGPILDSEHNFTTKEFSNNILNFEKFSLTLLPVLPKTFLMGSPSSLTAPKAITRSFGDELITGSSDGQLGITDFSGRPIKKIADFNSSITCIDATSDDQWIIVGCSKGEVHLLDGKSLQVKRTIKDHAFPLTSTIISLNAESFATSGLDGKLNYYSLPSCDKIWTVHARDHNTSFDFLEYNSAGTRILTSGPGATPNLFDTKTGEEISLNPFPYLGIRRSHFLPNSESFASITESGLLIFTETTHGLVYKIVRLNLENIIDFSFSPHGKKMIILTKEGLCSIRETPINNNLCIKNEKDGIIYSPDFFFALANKTEPSSKNLPDYLNNLGLPKELNISQKGFRLSPNKKLVLTTLDGALRLWCFDTGEWISTLGDKFVSPFIDCTFSPDGKLIVAKLLTNEFLIYPITKLPSTDSPNYKIFSKIETWFK